MKKKIKNINGWNIIWLLIYLMPFLISLGFTFIYAYGVKGNITSVSEYSNIFLQSNYVNNISYFFGGVSGFLSNAIRNLLSYFNIISSSNLIFYTIFPLAIQYIVVVSITRIGVDVILMLPNIVHNFIDKIGGERE